MMVAICVSCKRIRDPEGTWWPTDRDLAVDPDVQLTHGFCPECAHRLYPEHFPERSV